MGAHAKTAFDSKIVMLTDTVVAHAEASELDRTLIKEETKALEAELNHALDRAISIGRLRQRLSHSASLSTLRTPSVTSRSSSTTRSRLLLTTCSRSLRASVRCWLTTTSR